MPYPPDTGPRSVRWGSWLTSRNTPLGTCYNTEFGRFLGQTL